ncbi:sodium:solute symporter family transporter [Haloferula sp.]|uniref:sodium:solute symporter family transporter n=1 Tax=Haloferula sp. TaxID=2497595 RepID=UPI00329C8E08
MITGYDLISVAFYVLFILGVGLSYARRSKDTSDYFRAGGMMPWWVTGASAWMAGFSAWSFTGAAGKMFTTGPYSILLFYSILIPLVVLLLFTCHRFRRMQVITPFEAVRLRFGPGSQLFFTWARLPFMLIFGGVTLNAVGVFMAAVLGAETPLVILVLGTSVTMLAMLGGAFGVVASDFVQMFLVVTVTVLVTVLALNQPDIGGLSGMIEKAPSAHTNWSEFVRPQFVILWFVALMITKLFEENSIDKSAKFLMVRSDRDARLTLVIPLIGMVLAPLIWLVPPTVAAIRHGGDIGEVFSTLKFPEEGAFVLTASEVLPTGMLGLLLCGIFAATMTSMDAGLNQGAGIFVRNFYLPFLRPDCSEKRLLIVSKIATGVFGGIMVGCAFLWETMRDMQLFDLLTQVAISLGLPMSIPLFLGLFCRKTPKWAGWSTVLVGLAGSFLVRFWLKPEMFEWIPGMEGPFLPEEVTTFRIFASVILVGSGCVAWFFASRLFYDDEDLEYVARVDEFFGRLETPVELNSVARRKEGSLLAGSIGKLCLIYGAFVSLLVLIPNPVAGRLCFLVCGGVMLVVGGLIRVIHRKGSKETPGAESD